MKQFTFLFRLLIILQCFCYPKFGIYGQSADTLTIIHLNDTHSTLAPLAPRPKLLEGTTGGIARAASLIYNFKATEKNVLTLHAGDFFIGDIFFNLYFGVPELHIMKEIGFDAMALGNHEFDLTPETLLGVFQNAFVDGGFPILSANALCENEKVKPLKNFVNPYIIKNMGKMKIGIFGLTTPETNIFSLPAPIVFDDKLPKLTLQIVKKLKEEGCNIIVCLSHLGLSTDKQIAENIPGINIIVGGHDHLALFSPIEISNPLNKTWIVQADAFYKYLGVMKIEQKNDALSLLDYELIPLDESIPELEPVKYMVDQLISDLESTFGIPFFSKAIAYAQDNFEEVANLNSSGMYDTPVGNLITAAYLSTMKTDIALITGGSTAQKIYKGPVTPIDIFRMIGYGFNEKNGLGYRIATFDITGEELWKGIETCVSQVEINDELLAQVSGMRYLFNINNPVGKRVEYIEVKGKMIDPTATYSVATNEFLINAFPMFGINISNIQVFEDLTEFEVVLNYVMAKEILVPELKAPVTGLEETQSVIPNQYLLEQNYPNPFNPRTTILYQIAEQGIVELKVYDSLGQLISTLVNKEQSPGHYKAFWNAENVASGIYFYQLKCGNFSEIKKMLFIK